MRLERKIEVHVEEKLGNGSIDKDMGNMAVKRYFIMGGAVKMTLKYGCINRL